MTRRMSEWLASQAQQAFTGRETELDFLRSVLTPEGPWVLHVHGIAGIGKTALLEKFAREARDDGAIVIHIDCRNVEPTERGFLGELSEAVGGVGHAAEALAQRLDKLNTVILLALDNYDAFRLLDVWLRQVFLPTLPDRVRVLMFGRQRPSAGWYATPGWGHRLQAVAMTPLNANDAISVLTQLGLGPEEAALIARSTHGHPLALKLAAASVRNEPPGYCFSEAPIQQAVDELTHVFLADVSDPVTRRVLEGAAVTRRSTISLLRAIFPDLAPQDVYERLSDLPFVDCVSDGLVVQEAVRDAIARSLHASDPCRYLEYRRAAWRQLVSEAQFAGSGDLWRYTADMLYLIENPVVREAFFPRDTSALSVEMAQQSDAEDLLSIVYAQEGMQAAESLLSWWRRLPQSFHVVRDRVGQVVGLYCKLRSDLVEPRWLSDDPVTASWCDHLRCNPLPDDHIALFCRRWLASTEGDSPGEVQAAVWLDLKRHYMELRPRLRRVYLLVRDLSAYAPVAQRLGLVALTGRELSLDGAVYHTAMLDFGVGSVDGWLAALAASELGVQSAVDLLDLEARELVMGTGRVSLTPLEFGVMQLLAARTGKAVSRSDLLREVWGTRYEGGSNVVDAVVRTLRRKLGEHAVQVETVTGVGYRYRASHLV